MRHIVLLKNIEKDINSGEYTIRIHEPLFLGVIESKSEKDAVSKAKVLEEECYNMYNGAWELGFPELEIVAI